MSTFSAEAHNTPEGALCGEHSQEKHDGARSRPLGVSVPPIGVPNVARQALVSDLQIAGINAMSSVDWPGKLVATVFTQGCPWRCAYCHNQAIIDPRIPGVVDWSALEDLMSRRRGLLDGVVFSGGEATRQWALFPAARKVRSWGFEVGLHTAGPYPSRLRSLLADGCIDWVGLDIKALPGASYDEVAGRPHAGEKAWESLEILLESGVEYEVRLTVDDKGLPDAVAVARLCRERGVRSFALQEVRLQGVSEAYLQSVQYGQAFGGSIGGAEHDAGAMSIEEISNQIASLGFEQYVFRPAQ